MAIDYIPANQLFDVEFYGEMCHAIWETNLVFEKFFEIGYKAAGDFPNGEYEIIQVLELSHFGEKILAISGITITSIILLFLMIGIISIRNQRNLRKQLRQIQEQLEQKEDKPE